MELPSVLNSSETGVYCTDNFHCYCCQTLKQTHDKGITQDNKTIRRLVMHRNF
jgi:hypothetical protein